MMQKLSRLLKLATRLLLNIVHLLITLCPRDSTLWVFGAWNGKKFLDNPKYVFLHVLHTMPNIRVIWITRSPSLAKELRNKGLPAAYAGSFIGLWSQMRAGVVIFSHSVEWDLWAPLIARRVKRVQTWHGIPIKKIGYDDEKDISLKWAKWISLIFPYRDDRLDMVTAAGPADQLCYRTAFNVKNEAVVITGYARNDAMIKSALIRKEEVASAKRAIYMPTLRGSPGSEFLLFESTGFKFELIDLECKKINLHLWIKLHPVQKFRERDLVELRKCTNIHPYSGDGDIYELIGDYDILITDFSGIFIDFLILGRPIILAPLDMADYIENDRDLYYEYSELCWELPCVSWPEILERLQKICVSKFEPPEKYIELQARFHSYLDENSAWRVAKNIEQLTLKEKNNKAR